jgi:hypothetical protein
MRSLALPEPLKPALRTFVGVAVFAGVGLWALEPLRTVGGPPLRDYGGRATLVAALTVAFAAPAPLGNAVVVCAQRLVGGLLGCAAAAGVLAVPPPPTGARLAAGATLPLAAAAVFVGQDAGVQYGAQFFVLTYILITVEGSAAAVAVGSGSGSGNGSGAGLREIGFLAAARGVGVLAGALAAAVLGVAVAPQAASNAASRRLGDALAQAGGLARSALSPLEAAAEGGGGGAPPPPPPRPPWWRRVAAFLFLRSSPPLVAPVAAVGSTQRAGSAAAALTIADLLESAGPAAAAVAAVGATVRDDGSDETSAVPPLPLPSPPPGPDTATARAAAALAASLAAVEAALPWSRAEACAGRGGGRAPWARVWLPGRPAPASVAARARRLPVEAITEAVAALRAAASTLVLASTVRGAALTPAARAAVSSFWAEAGARAGLAADSSAAADPLGCLAGPAAEAWESLAAGWAAGDAAGAAASQAADALATTGAAARSAVRALLVSLRTGSDPAIPKFLAGVSAGEAASARALIRSRLALGALVVSDFQRAAAAVCAVEAGLPPGCGGWWGCWGRGG